MRPLALPLVISEAAEHKTMSDDKPKPIGENTRMRFARERRLDSARTRMNAPISVVLLNDKGKRVSTGTATLKNLSLQGALITDMKLTNDVEDFNDEYRIRFRLMAGPLAGMEGLCEPVRLDSAKGTIGAFMPNGFFLPIT